MIKFLKTYKNIFNIIPITYNILKNYPYFTNNKTEI